MKRASGILMHITSLPSKWGVGTLGEEAFRFVDFLKRSGQSYWQILPVGPTSYGDSPYQSYSTFAGNPFLIDLDILEKEGLLYSEEYRNINWGESNTRVSFDVLKSERFRILKLAFSRFNTESDEFIRFIREEKSWLDDYALYMALKENFEQKSWMEWERGLKLRVPEILHEYREKLKSEILPFAWLRICNLV